MNQRALQRCSVTLHNSLDIEVIYPYLVTHGLTTQNDQEKLTHPNSTNLEKINYLTQMLPKKGSDWLDKFIKCLEESSKEAPAHDEIAQELKDARKGKHYHNS